MNNKNVIGSRITKWLIVGPPLLFLLIFFVVPSLIMFVTSLRFPGEFGGLAPLITPAGKADDGYGLTLEAYKFLLSNTLYAEVFLKSFGVAAVTTLICLIMAYPLALLITNGLSACIVNHAQQKTFSKLDGVAGSTSICE
jgi:spermidine/putrescine transport system permease protein